MKIGTCILTICLAASAWAQSAASKQQAAPKPQAAPAPQQANSKLSGGPGPQQSAAKPNISASAKATAIVKVAATAPKAAAPATKNAKSAAGTKSATAEKQGSASSKAAAKAEKTSAKAGKQPAKQRKEASNGAPDKKVATASSVHKDRRDPFVSPIVERKLAVCTVGGKRCLFIADLNLVGIVECSNGTIAVVANGTHTYFLRENDPLADGEVERITSDAITMRQRTSDLMGHPVVKEVTRKIGMPAV